MTPSIMAHICSHCGSPIADDAKFCEQCGTARVAVTSSATGYWVIVNDKAQGPHTESTLREWLAEGIIAANTLAWQQGMVDWAPLITLLPNSTLTSRRPPPPSPSMLTSQGYGSRGFKTTGPGLSSSAARAALPAPPALHWSLVLLFGVLTLGVFWLIWLFVQANWVHKIDPQSKATLLLSIGIACGALGLIPYLTLLDTLHRNSNHNLSGGITAGVLAGIALCLILMLTNFILQG